MFLWQGAPMKLCQSFLHIVAALLQMQSLEVEISTNRRFPAVTERPRVHGIQEQIIVKWSCVLFLKGNRTLGRQEESQQARISGYYYFFKRIIMQNHKKGILYCPVDLWQGTRDDLKRSCETTCLLLQMAFKERKEFGDQREDQAVLQLCR